MSLTASGSSAAQLQVKNYAKPEERIMGIVMLYICTQEYVTF